MKTEKIQQSPFTLVVTDENQIYVTLGNKAVLQCETEEEALKKVDEKDYELLFNTMYLIKQTDFTEYETKSKNND